MQANVAELLDQWKAGDQTAADEIHRRYAGKLYVLARRQLGDRLQRRVSPEDVVQSVFRTFFRRADDWQFPDGSQELWPLLVRITINKVRRYGNHHRADRRDIGLERDGLAASEVEFAASDPSPSEVTGLLEELERVVTGLTSREQSMVGLRFEGFSTSEIANQLGCTRWTVRRVLDRIGYRLHERFQATA